MTLIIVLGCVALINFVIGALTAYVLCKDRTNAKISLEEKQIYCHGFEDGIYYTIDEYRPELYRPELAEMCYKEYKARKHGPEKH